MDQQNLSISNFKRFALQLFLPFIIICFSAGIVINYFFEKKIILGSEISGAYKVNKIINSLNKEEIPFFGSSRAEGTFIPDSLVKNGFNYGLSGTGDDVLLFFLNEECKKTGKTSPIIINFDLDGLNYGLGDESNYLYNSGYFPVRKLLGSKYKFIYNFSFLKYYGHFELYSKYYLNNKLNLTKYTNKGASIEKNELPKQKFEELVRKRLNETNTFQNNEHLLSFLLDLINSNKNRKLIFVITPYHTSFFKGFGNIKEAEMFLSFLRKFNNVVVLDFSKTKYPDNYFMNTTHLNLKGALEFNKLLRDSLNLYIR